MDEMVIGNFEKALEKESFFLFKDKIVWLLGVSATISNVIATEIMATRLISVYCQSNLLLLVE